MKKLILILTIFALVGCVGGNAAVMKKELANNAISADKGRIVVYRRDTHFYNSNIGFFIDGKMPGEIHNSSILYFDVNEGEHQVSIDRKWGGENVIINVKKNGITYVKIYASYRTGWTGVCNIEAIEPQIAINEIAELK